MPVGGVSSFSMPESVDDGAARELIRAKDPFPKIDLTIFHTLVSSAMRSFLLWQVHYSPMTVSHNKDIAEYSCSDFKYLLLFFTFTHKYDV